MSIEDLHQLFIECGGVSTDTRSIRSESLFIALRGEHFDGASFILDAFEKGAGAAMANESSISLIENDARFPKYEDRIVYVPDSLAALQELAHFHRMRFKLPVIGITGTNGKTTTKELAAEVLSEKFRIVKTEGNLNNHIGVPLTLLRIRATTEVAIIEMGASRINDIRDLCAIAEPTHGIITNIGLAHLEGFGSKEGVAKAKGALYEWLRDHKGTIFINRNDAGLAALLWKLDPGCKAETVRYGDEMMPENKNLFGAFNQENMRAASAIGARMKVPKASITKALKNYAPTNMRSQIILTKKDNEIYLDAYNANPSSMKAALQSFSELQTARPKWLMLGDMMELGDAAAEAHAKAVADISFYGFTNVILIGEHFSAAHGERKRYACYRTKEEFLASPFAASIRHAAILIKGSNSMRMWEIAEVM